MSQLIKTISRIIHVQLTTISHCPLFMSSIFHLTGKNTCFYTVDERSIYIWCLCIIYSPPPHLCLSCIHICVYVFYIITKRINFTLFTMLVRWTGWNHVFWNHQLLLFSSQFRPNRCASYDKHGHVHILHMGKKEPQRVHIKMLKQIFIGGEFSQLK